MWTFQGITTLSSALEAFQAQLDVTGNNIANVNTAGYSEETANLVSSPSTPVTEGNTFQIGNGVTVQSVTRIQATYLQGSAYNAASALGMANQQATTASSVNSTVLNGTTTGFESDISAFFNSWSSLASDPSSSSEKLAVQQAGQTLANDFQTAGNGILQLQTTNTQQIQSTIQTIQSDVNQIASLNQQIENSTAQGGTPNAMMDQRDQVVSNLASLMNVTVQNTSGGGVTINSGDLILVDQSGAHNVPTTYNAATSSLTSGANSFNISSGQLAGLFDSSNKLGSYQTSLNTLADQIQTQVNTLYATAADSTGTTGADFFSTTGSGATGLALDPTIANNPDAILTGTSGNASDGGVAQSIADLATTSNAALGNQSITDYYTTFVGQIGTDGKQADASQTTSEAVNTQVQNQVQSITGVNLDDEMSNLLRFQRSYQAAAQALNTIDQTISGFLSAVQTG